MSTPERPGPNDEAVDALLAERMLGRVLDWLRQSGEKDPDGDEVREELEEVMELETDGYQIARNLDNKGWDVDADLVAILDSAQSKRYFIANELVAKWVTDNNILPPLAVGAIVGFKQERNTYAGEITKIDAKHATYTVFCGELGHVREGNGTYGVILPYELALDPPQPAIATP